MSSTTKDRSLKTFLQKHFALVCRPLQAIFASCRYWLCDIRWQLKGHKLPHAGDRKLVEDNVTFIYKSFERQRQAASLYRCILKYYPKARVVIADDSSKPLHIKGENLSIIQMPFNSGLSKGLNLALAEVQTPFLVRMDDDELLTRHLDIAAELRFLHNHVNVDLVGFLYINSLKPFSVEDCMGQYAEFDMREATRRLLVPHGTYVDEKHIVLGKVPNIFLARTDAIKKVGWDDNIRMIDHHDFFYRAAGVIVSVLSLDAIVFHNHNYFMPKYNVYRSDWLGDYNYIRLKRINERRRE